MRGKEHPATWERPYDCRRDCQRDDGTWDAEKRRARGCTRVGLPPVAWDVDVRALYSRVAAGTATPGVRGMGLYLGREPGQHPDIDPSVIGISVPEDEPVESPAEGCPAGWACSPFADSVALYARQRTKDGGRVPNRFLDAPETPWQVWEAVYYLEAEQDRWHHYRESVDAERWRSGPGKPKKGG